MLVLILLEFPWACSFSGASFISVASWNRLLLCKSWDDPGTKFGFSILQVALGGNDISINTEVWYNVIFWLLVLVFLKFPWACGLGKATFVGVACWDRMNLSKSWDNPLFSEWFLSIIEVAGGSDDVSIDSKVWYNVVFWMLVLILLEFPWTGSLSGTSFISITSWNRWHLN